MKSINESKEYFKNLAEEYRQEEKKLTEIIARRRKELKNLSGAKLHIANRELLCFYEMRREVQSTAETLENYYDNKADSRIYHKKSALI